LALDNVRFNVGTDAKKQWVRDLWKAMGTPKELINTWEALSDGRNVTFATDKIVLGLDVSKQLLSAGEVSVGKIRTVIQDASIRTPAHVGRLTTETVAEVESVQRAPTLTPGVDYSRMAAERTRMRINTGEFKPRIIPASDIARPRIKGFIKQIFD